MRTDCEIKSAHQKELRLFKSFLELGLLLTISLATYCAVLKFVFPGYLSPLWPHHSDFYLPASLAGGVRDVFTYINWPRPVGMAFFVLIGNLGTRGAIAAVIALTIFNAGFSVFLLRRFSGLHLSAAFWLFSISYFYILFSSPFFYVFYSQDAFAQLSYFLLATGIAVYAFMYMRHLLMAAVLLFFCSLAAFLAKETYSLSAVGLAGIFFIFSPKTERFARLMPLMATLSALILSFIYGSAIKSVFLGLAGDAYQTNYSPLSLAREWWRYATDGLNFLSIAALGFAVFACWWFGESNRKANAAKAIVCILLGCAAWLPNATLPLHYFPGYSWNGAYLLFLPLVLVASTVGRSTLSVGLALVIAGAIFASPLLNRRKYEGNGWVLQQEATQRNFLSALGTEVADLPVERPSHVLITGLTFPFSPFYYPRALEQMVGGRYIFFDIVSYSSQLKSDSETVHFLWPAAVDVSQYDAIWELRPDGTMRSTLTPPVGDAASFADERCPSRWCFILYPSLADITKPIDGVFNASQYMEMGLIWLNYSNYVAAVRALRKSAELDPKNPYVFFYLGNAWKMQGDLPAAATAYTHAVEFDDPTNRNPYFESSLSGVQREMRKKAP